MTGAPSKGTDLSYQAAATYLRGLGVAQSEITVILDIAMNPYSVYGKASRKQPANPHVSAARSAGALPPSLLARLQPARALRHGARWLQSRALRAAGAGAPLAAAATAPG